jgi:hypothetical protein
MAQCSRLQTNFMRMAATIGLAVFGFSVIQNLMEFGLPGSVGDFRALLIPPLLGGLGSSIIMPLAMLLIVQPIQMWQLRRQNPFLFGGMELNTDENGVEIRGPRSTSRWNWSDLRGFKENGQIFLLCISKSCGVAIPKQGMSPEVVDEFRDHWSQKIKRI